MFLPSRIRYPLVGDMHPDPTLDPDPDLYIIMQNTKKSLDSYLLLF
jgi:hypothetical protein